MYIQEGGRMYTAKVFQSGNSQAIRIPKEMKTDKNEFIIKKMGDCFFLIPPNDQWALLKQTIGALDEEIDFDRDQPMISDQPERAEVL